jgi:hypothetical protein
MAKKSLLTLSLLIALTFVASNALAIITMDKTPTNANEDNRNASLAAVSSEKVLKDILVEAKKTNELLAQLVAKQ